MMKFVGKKVRDDIVSDFGVTLVSAGSMLDEELIGLLGNHQVDLYSLELLDSGPRPVINFVDQAVLRSKELFESIGLTGKVPVEDIKGEVIPLVLQVSQHSNLFQLFESVKAVDEYTYQHNIGVGILSTLIGRWMELPDEELEILSLAGTLHDVGKVYISGDILNKPGKLTKEEYEQVKRHAQFGYDLLCQVPHLDPRIPLAALQHHERNDGRGYPFGAKEHDIELFSKIIAVADIFHAMSSRRSYHEPRAFYEIADQMRDDSFGLLDPMVVTLFLDKVMEKLIGETVLLTDGHLGEVISLNPHQPLAPLVKVGEEFIDLSRRTDIHIKSIFIPA